MATQMAAIDGQTLMAAMSSGPRDSCRRASNHAWVELVVDMAGGWVESSDDVRKSLQKKKSVETSNNAAQQNETKTHTKSCARRTGRRDGVVAAKYTCSLESSSPVGFPFYIAGRASMSSSEIELFSWDSAFGDGKEEGTAWVDMGFLVCYLLSSLMRLRVRPSNGPRARVARGAT